MNRRLRGRDISKVLVASDSGKLALAFKKAIPDATIVCVTCDEETRIKFRKPSLMKEQLLSRDILVVDATPEPLSQELTFRNWWEDKSIRVPRDMSDLFWMTLICVGGHGFRTAVEIVFMAVEAGVVEVGERVIAVAGTGWGCDSAIVMRATQYSDAVGEDPKKRMKVEEILAMPKHTEWKGYG